MIGHAFPEGTREALLFLATAGVVVPVFTRLRVSPVLGFLLAGIGLGPFGLGALAHDGPILAELAITDPARIEGVAEFGVVFLLFMVGLELSFERLSRLRRLVFGLGAVQVAGSAGLVATAALGFGLKPAAATVIGLALALSSTAVVVPVLAESGRLRSAAGRTAFSVLLFQDLAVAPLLFTVAALSAPGGQSLGSELVFALGPAVAALVVVVVLGRLVLRPLFHVVAATRSTEFFMAACLLVVIGAGALTAASGLSMSLGAFMAGLLLAETEFRREIEVTIEPFKGLLLGLFFVSIGVGLDLSALIAHPVAILLLGLALIVAKAAVIFGAARLFRLPPRIAIEVALLLGPSGEFAFVLIAQAFAGGLVPGPVAHLLVVAVTLTMMTIPLLALLAERLGRLPKRQVAESFEPPPEDETARVIIVGFGRVGRLVGEMVAVHGLPFIAIDDDVGLVRREREVGTPIYYGDATRRDFLHRCGLANAKGLVATINNSRVTELVVEAARAERADLTIVARARDAAHARKLYDLGANDAVPETIEASLQLSEAVLVDMGVAMGLVIASIHEKRDEFRKLLNETPEGEPDRRSIRRRAGR
ncbi:MAG TPA: cation:proton antiporter [Lichenihabitans sp.]|jgi:CPA2 family monovalent cation:H+ antiporter-2|nr:cation:proton antiporter [Lichenihabitans sp.]